MLQILKRRSLRYAQRPMNLHLNWLFIGANLVLLSIVLFDQPVAAYFLKTNSLLKRIGAFMTDTGNSAWILMASALLLIEAVRHRRAAKSFSARFNALFLSQLAAYVFLAVSISGVSANILKRLIGRARPAFHDGMVPFDILPLHNSYQYMSFPSGHATTVGAVMMAVALIVPSCRLLCLILALWFGFSRVMIGVHFTSDVIAGLSFGAWFSIILAVVFSRYGLVFRETEQGLPCLRTKLRRPFARWKDERLFEPNLVVSLEDGAIRAA